MTNVINTKQRFSWEPTSTPVTPATPKEASQRNSLYSKRVFWTKGRDGPSRAHGDSLIYAIAEPSGAARGFRIQFEGVGCLSGPPFWTIRTLFCVFPYTPIY